MGGRGSVGQTQSCPKRHTPRNRKQPAAGISNEVEKLNEERDAEKVAGACDKLSKLAATIEKLDKKASVVDAIEVFIGFGKWLQHRATNDEELTPELIKAINRFQDLYVSELLSTKGQ